MSSVSSKHVPNPEEVILALSSHRATKGPSGKRLSAKSLLKKLQTDHPDWKLSQQRMIKILKKDEETNENSQTASNVPAPSPSANIFSPNSRVRIAKADSPVSTKNVISSRLRPKAALSFVYGKARKMRTPKAPKVETYCPYETAEGEYSDPSFIPLESGEVVESSPWVRAEKKELSTPEVVIVKDETPKPVPIPPSPPTVARTIVSELIKEDAKSLASPMSETESNETDDFVAAAVRENSITAKESTSCFSAFTQPSKAKESCSVM